MNNVFTIGIALILFTIFLFLATLHFYWALGGRWGNKVVFPTKDNTMEPVMPGFIPTFMVALGLLSMAFFILAKGVQLNIFIPSWIDHYGLWAISGIFILRAIGEFNYVGFFKKVRNTQFAHFDTKYYSPLSLFIGMLTLLMELCK